MKTAVLAPLYVRDLELGRNFVKEYNRFFDNTNYANNLYMCFSDQSEIDNFNCNHKYNAFVCTEKLDVSKKPISQKKLFGVRHIFENTNHENVMVVDIDRLTLKTNPSIS